MHRLAEAIRGTSIRPMGMAPHFQRFASNLASRFAAGSSATMRSIVAPLAHQHGGLPSAFA